MDSDSDSNASFEVEDHSPPISMTEGHVQPYAFEQLAHAAVEMGAAAAESEEAAERTGEVSEWCSCGHCHRMADVRENICCREIDKVMAKCGEVDEVVACMTAHPGFEPVCLNPWVLQVADASYRQEHGDFEAPINRRYRHAAYRNFVLWCWGYLGKRVRVRLPACVVMGIRQNFPDPSGDYTGFKWPPM